MVSKLRLLPVSSLAAFVALALLPHNAFGEPSQSERDRARTLMDKGDLFVDAKSYAEALDAYEQADAIMHVPTTTIEVARAHAAVGHYILAREAALRAARAPKEPGEPAVFDDARKEAAALAGDVAQKIGALVIEITPRDATPIVAVDGAVSSNPSADPVPIDPGEHTVRVAAESYEAKVATVVVHDGETAHVTIALEREDATKRTLMYAGFGTAGAGLLAGTIFGALSLSQASSARAQCVGNVCPPSARGDIDASKSFGTVSDVAFVIGLAGAAVGGWALYTNTREKPAQTARVHATIGLGAFGIAGELP